MDTMYEFILNLFLDNGIIIAVCTFIVGQILKGINKIPNYVIPIVGGLLGIFLGIFIPNLFEGKDTITSAVLGLALGWAATGGYETIKNLKNLK